MDPAKVSRDKVNVLTDLPNIGKKMTEYLNLVGVEKPLDLLGRCPYAMYDDLCNIKGLRLDPCVIDVFISVTRFMSAGVSKPWWDYTEERKEYMKSL